MNIEGRNQVLEALKSEKTINKIYIDKNYASRKDEIIREAKSMKIKCEFVPKNVLDKISVTSHHQGYIAESVDFSYCDVDDILN